MPDKSGNYNPSCTNFCAYLESIYCIISKELMVNQSFMIHPDSGISIAHYVFYMNQKQIDNFSKYCYDLSKLMIAFPVIGNMLSDKFSWKTLSIGCIATFIFLFVGYFLDKKEADKDDST